MLRVSRTGVLSSGLLCAALLSSCGDAGGNGQDLAPDNGLGGAGADAGWDPACPPGLQLCGSGCVALDRDNLNCGWCGNACLAGSVCQGGGCVCQPGLTDCFGSCVNLAADPFNCGACLNACGQGLVCSAGTCSASCAPGLTQCGQSCVDLLTSAAHCGACNVACDGGRVCQQGSCTCPGGLTLCAGSCVDIWSDPAHCGGCGLVCNGSCVSGTCSGGMGGSGGASGSGGTGAASAVGGSGGDAQSGGSGGSSDTGGASGSGGGAQLCTDECRWAGDGECDDGGPGALYWVCEYGTDCTDCGPRPDPGSSGGTSGTSGSGGTSGIGGSSGGGTGGSDPGSCWLTLPGATGNEPGGQIPVCCTPSAEQKTNIDEVFALLNAYRAASGRPALAYDPLLEAAVQGHCQHMAQHSFFDHTAPEPAVSSAWTRAELCGTEASGENIAQGRMMPEEVMDGWKRSSGHNENMLDSRFTRVGICNYGNYWAQLFD